MMAKLFFLAASSIFFLHDICMLSKELLLPLIDLTVFQAL